MRWVVMLFFFFFFSSRRRHTRCSRDWSSDVCSSDLLTSLSDPDEVIEGLSCGADSFITKPYNKEYLIANIKKILTEKATPESKRDTVGIEINYGGEKKQ